MNYHIVVDIKLMQSHVILSSLCFSLVSHGQVVILKPWKSPLAPL